MNPHINRVYVSNDSEIGQLMQSMREQEERQYIQQCRQGISENKLTKEQAKRGLTRFMQMWEPGTREFPLIQKYITEELDS